MNSDFMQQQAEALARRVDSETNVTARIQKLYSLLFARTPTETELAAGQAYLASEPMKAYTERKAVREKEELETKDKPDKKGKSDDKEEEGESGEDKKMEPGMMAGVSESGGQGKPPPKILPVTVDGRYAKLLMSSHEFLFIR